ncbi:helix-turn-helix transcriptional regulator [Cryptosporangium aurantiacum]|uniref:Predicted DNA-binding transcriptional regulator YafY, contains an HTH and WYL domains n=1 Tax=Cryptosporangium aurantiacum TaxID=134849 RepID=A0A1M7TX78_9ACTN|nr:YafY family protein [Cryptosporangium aurantiacum]SHN75349.1 Predicted DNA-binding transcriptional regulator YafY, contains an HTH and WYL domains [Cryptosporangium aurantiacum]
MLDTSARLLRLLGLLQTHREWTGTALAGELAVTARTVRRDVEKLRALGYPIDAVGGVGGGYRLAAGAALPPLLLDDDEAVAVAVGLRGAASGAAVTGIAESSVRALAKLDQVLPSRLRYRVATLSDAVVSLPGRGPSVDATTLVTIATAIRDTTRLRFDYTSGTAEATIREVEPYRLVNAGRRWYLLSWDVARTDWRTFRVDRLRVRTPGGPRFAPRPLPTDDLAAYLDDALARAPYRYEAVLVLHGTPDAVRAEVPAWLGVVEERSSDSCTVRIGSDDLDQLAVWVSTFGFDFEVLEPAELRTHLRALAARMHRAARRPK